MENEREAKEEEAKRDKRVANSKARASVKGKILRRFKKLVAGAEFTPRTARLLEKKPEIVIAVASRFRLLDNPTETDLQEEASRLMADLVATEQTEVSRYYDQSVYRSTIYQGCELCDEIKLCTGGGSCPTLRNQPCQPLSGAAP